MEALRQLPILSQPIDISVLYRRIRDLEECINEMKVRDNTLKVSTQEGLEIIPVRDIVRCRSDNNYTHIYLDKGAKICISKTLKFIQEQLPENLFLRVHSSHLINIHSARKISRGRDQVILLEDGTLIPISRKYAGNVREAFS